MSLGSLWEVWATPGTLQEYALVEVKPPFSRNLGAQSRIASGTHSGVVLGYLLEAFGHPLNCFGVHLIAFGCPLSSFRVRMESFEVPLGDFWDPLGSFSCHKGSFYVNLMYLVRYLEDFGDRGRGRAQRGPRPVREQSTDFHHAPNMFSTSCALSARLKGYFVSIWCAQ